MLIEDLIRLGRPLLESDQFQAEDVLRLISGIEDERVKNFYRHVFVVEVPTDESRSPRVLPMQQLGELSWKKGKEDFQVDQGRALGMPFVLPSANPTNAQGRFVPVYPLYHTHIIGKVNKKGRVSKGFRETPDAVSKFLLARIKRTIGFSLSKRMVDSIAVALHEAIARTDFGKLKNVLGILVLAQSVPDGYFHVQSGKSPQRIGETADGRSIVPNYDRLLRGFWEAKLEEGKELGSRTGACSFSGAKGELVSAYCKAWPWAFPTWTCPLPHGGDDRMLVESVALTSETYEALTLGACVFNRLTKPIDRLRIVPELFSPVETRAGKDQARHRKNMTTIYGSGLLLPVRDELFLDRERKVGFVEGVQSMLAADRQDPTMADRYMTAVVGFDLMLPEGTTDDYRLTLVYFSGEFSRGDIHLRAYIQDVIPSLLGSLRNIGYEEAKRARQLLEALMPKMSDKQAVYLVTCYASIPYLLARAYGGAYLWQQLEAALHRQPLGASRVIANAAHRMNSLTPRWPDSRFELCEEVGFFLSFLRVLNRVNRELADLQEDPSMRPWKDLLRMIDHEPVTELKLDDPSEIGFACGALIKRFSRAYYKAMKTSKPNPDFLRDRVLTFGSDLRPAAVHDKGLRMILELPNRLKSLGRGRDLEERTGAVIGSFQQNRDAIDKDKNTFITAFWSGYALEGHDRPARPRTCPHCGEPLVAPASSHR